MDVNERADALAEYMASKLRVNGKDLRTVMARAGRRLPRHLRVEAEKLAQATEMTSHPRLSQFIDEKSLVRADRKVRRFLARQDPSKARRGEILDVIAKIAFVIFTVVLVAFFVLLSRGAFN